MPLPPNASITDVINKLSELEGINQKTELASVIGAPATSTDTVAQQIVKLQDIKNVLSDNLNRKGIIAENTEPLEILTEKVNDIETGKKYTEMSITQNYGSLSFNTGFKPSVVFVDAAIIQTSTGNVTREYFQIILDKEPLPSRFKSKTLIFENNSVSIVTYFQHNFNDQTKTLTLSFTTSAQAFQGNTKIYAWE